MDRECGKASGVCWMPRWVPNFYFYFKKPMTRFSESAVIKCILKLSSILQAITHDSTGDAGSILTSFLFGVSPLPVSPSLLLSLCPHRYALFFTLIYFSGLQFFFFFDGYDGYDQGILGAYSCELTYLLMIVMMNRRRPP